MSKTNPRNIPRTEADCRREFRRGQDEGAARAVVITLWTMVDAFHATPEQIQMFERELAYNLDSVAKGTAKLEDFVIALHDEYGVALDWGGKQ